MVRLRRRPRPLSQTPDRRRPCPRDRLLVPSQGDADNWLATVSRFLAYSHPSRGRSTGSHSRCEAGTANASTTMTLMPPTRATVELLTTDQGGRKGGIISGYRGLARFGGSDSDFGFELTLDEPSLALGERREGTLRFWAPGVESELTPGRPFEIRDGRRLVGHGEILGEPT